LPPEVKRRRTELKSLVSTPDFQKYCENTRINWKILPLHTYSDYREIRSNMCFFRDTTGIIGAKITRQIKNCCSFLRPPRFGKSTLVSIMQYFYDVDSAEHFEFYFKGTDAYKYKEHANQDLVLRLNLSTVPHNNLGTDIFFGKYVAQSLEEFVQRYHKHVNFTKEFIAWRATSYTDENLAGEVILFFERIFSFIGSKSWKIVILIDEYDAPFNRVMFQHGDFVTLSKEKRTELFSNMITFYATVKQNLQHVAFCFLTGVFRMALAEISVGFNCCADLSREVGLADAIGFVDHDVEMLGGRYNINEVAMAQMRSECNGYCFSIGGKSVFCTNLVMEKIEKGVSTNEFYSTLTDNFDMILKRVASTLGGRNLLYSLLQEQNVPYDYVFDSKFRFDQLCQVVYVYSLSICLFLY
jgi:hypothetical protein